MSAPIETLLRTSLADEAGDLDVTPDPWPGFAVRERRHRRSRRTRRVAVAAAVTAVLGVQSGLVPLPGWAPAVAIAGRPTLLTDGPTRGSLAGDVVWLEEMRGLVRDVEDPGELWKVRDREQIRFVYAGDVGDQRLVLMLVPLRFGLIGDWMLTWYSGPLGAAPGQMSEGGREDGGQTVSTYAMSSANRPGFAVVVGPDGSTVTLARGFTYTAEGRVERGKPVTYAPGSGLAEVTLPPVPMAEEIGVTVTQGGRTLYTGGTAGGWGGTVTTEPTDAQITGALGDRTFDLETLRFWVGQALNDARLPAAGTAIEVRWTGTVNGQPAALFTLRPGKGGVLAYAIHGSDSSFRQDYRALFPAAGVGERPMAWRMRAEGKDDRTDAVIVTAPPGAARVELVAKGAAPVAVPLDATGSGTTTLDPSTPAEVIAYDAAGRETGRTPVLPFETNMGGLPGADEKTRIAE